MPIERAKIAAPLPATPSTIILSENLDSLGEMQKPAMKFSASTREPPQSATFRFGVTENGVVRYCFLQTTSGDGALDEQAHAYLKLCRFVPTKSAAITDPDRLSWATATIAWGNDVIAPPAAPAGPALP